MKRKILTGLAMTMMLNTVISVSASSGYTNKIEEQESLLEISDENIDTSEEIEEEKEQENTEEDTEPKEEIDNIDKDISTYSESKENTIVSRESELNKPVTVWKIDSDTSSGFTGMFEDTATVITKDDGTKAVKLTINTEVNGLELSDFKYSFDNENFEELELTEKQEEVEIELPKEYNDKENYLIYFGASYTVPVVGEMSHIARVIIGDTSEFAIDNSGNTGSTGSDSSSSGNNQKYEIENGRYTVDVYLYKDNLSELSMADSVLNRSAIIDANNGVYTISFSTKPMSFGSITDVLRDLLYLKDGSYVQADVIARNNAIGNETNLPSAFSFVLPSVSDYIPVKVTHPKVAGLGDTYLDAQLKIDWSTLKANSNAELSTDTTVSTANVEKVELTDEKTGIKINATADVIPTTSSIKVSTITEGEEYNKILEILGEDFETFIAHNIAVLEDGEDVLINGNVKVSIPLPAGYSAEKLAIYRINSDGTKTIIKANVEDDLIVFETSSLGIFAIAQTLEEQFIETEDLEAQLSQEILMLQSTGQSTGITDIENHWAKASIEFVLENGIFVGTSDSEFSPDNAMTRGMLVEVIKRIENTEQGYKNASTSFEDISPDNYYFEAVIWANKIGIVSGVSETEFAPNKAVTREEAVVIFERYLQYKGIDIKTIYRDIVFNDEENISNWAINSINSLTEAGIIKGIDGNFEPKSSMTRAEVATLIEGLLKEYFGY